MPTAYSPWPTLRTTCEAAPDTLVLRAKALRPSVPSTRSIPHKAVNAVELLPGSPMMILPLKRRSVRSAQVVGAAPGRCRVLIMPTTICRLAAIQRSSGPCSAWGMAAVCAER
ncbi:hypothetical protein D9M68_943900 [compost metagenome]